MCNGCHRAMDVINQWMSQSNGCHNAMDVTKHCMSQSIACYKCHKAMDVIEQWMSQSNGCHKSSGCHTAMDVTRAMVVTEQEQWMSQRQSNECHKAIAMDVPKQWLSQEQWISQEQWMSWHESFVFTSPTLRFLREVSQESFASTSSALSLFEESLAQNAFLRDTGCTKCCVLQDKTCRGRWMGKLVRRAGAEHVRFRGGSWSDRPRRGTDSSVLGWSGGC